MRSRDPGGGSWCTVHDENPLGKRKLVRLDGDPL